MLLGALSGPSTTHYEHELGLEGCSVSIVTLR